jgi:hypothetical protein
VLDTDTLPAELVQDEPRPPVVLEDELLLEDELVLLLLEDELLLEVELVVEPPLVVGAYEHQADVTPENAPPKFELEQATLLVKVP